MSAIPGERAERVGRAITATATVVAFFLVFAPILIVLVTAFSPTEYFVFPPPGLSLRWFEEFFRLDNMRAAFVLSLQVALSEGRSSGLTWLLRLSDSIVTYRSRYMARPEWLPVLDLGKD